MRRILTLLFLAQAALAAPALALCTGQQGSVIYEDVFADSYGGWDLLDNEAWITPGKLVLDPSGNGGTSTDVHVLTFFADNADICSEFAWPAAPAGNRIAVGVDFWATGYDNNYLFQIDSGGQASLWRYQEANGWTSLVPLTDFGAINTKSGAVNSVRITVQDTLLTLIVNGQEFRRLRAQKPDGNLRFGVYAQLDANQPLPTPIEVRHFRVTTGTPGS